MPLRPLGPAKGPSVPLSSLLGNTDSYGASPTAASAAPPLAPPPAPPQPMVSTAPSSGLRLKPLGPATGRSIPLASLQGSPGTAQPSTTGSRLQPLQGLQEPPAFKIGNLDLTQSQADNLEKNGDNSERLLIAIEKRRRAPEQFGLEKQKGWGTYVKERLPFYAHGLYDKTKAAKDATLHLESPDRMDDDSISNLANVIVGNELSDAEESQKGILTKGLDLATQIPAIGIEFATTLGAAAAGKAGAKYAAKKGAEKLLPVFVKGALERAIGKVTNRLTGAAATAAIAGQIMPYTNPFKNEAAVAERMLPTIQGDQIVPGESEKDARFNNAVDNTIEAFTEQLGVGLLGKAMGTLGKAIPAKIKNLSGVQVAMGVKAATAKWLAEKAGLKMPEAMKYLADKANYHGVAGEMIEERYGEGVRAVSDAFLGTDLSQGGGVSGNLGGAAYEALKGEYGDAADRFVGALAQLAVEGIGFSVPGLAGRAAGFGSKALGVNYEHTPEYARKWAEANPEAAKQLAERDPQTLSRSLYASLGLPVTTGKKGREEFQDWVVSEEVPQGDEYQQPIDQTDEQGIPLDEPGLMEDVKRRFEQQYGDRPQAPYSQDMPPEVNEAAANTGSIHRSERPEPKRMGAKPLWRDNILDSLKSWQNKGDPKQLMAHLAKTKGTTEEAKWIGLDEFLADKKSVTKDEVREFVKANQVELKEVEKGKPEDPLQPAEWSEHEDHGYSRWSSPDSDFNIRQPVAPITMGELNKLPEQEAAKIIAEYKKTGKSPIVRGKFQVKNEGSYLGQFDTLDEAKAAVEEYRKRNRVATNPVKYSNYTVPGGENYRELLITKPNAPDENSKYDGEFRKWWLQTRGKEAIPSHVEEAIRAGEHHNTAMWSDFMEQSGIGAKRSQRIKSQYKSSHWDEPNILAHVRLDERKDEDGKKVLFIEEVQSDWHQAGREKGYEKPGDRERNEAELRRVQDELRQVYARIGIDHSEARKAVEEAKAKDQVGEHGMATWNAMNELSQLDRIRNAIAGIRGHKKTSFQEILREQSQMLQKRYENLAKEHGRLVERESELQDSIAHNRETVPDAPYKTSWPMLAMRRMIRYASDNGFDRIAWTPGSVQNERYDLSKSVDWLEYTTPEKSSSGIGSLKAYKQQGGQSATQVYSEDVAPEDLSNHVGKAVAEKLLAVKPDKYGVHILEGDGLRIGGGGMEGFYDAILPAEANKLIKKWGAKVGKTNVVTKQRREFASVPVASQDEIASYANDGWVLNDLSGQIITPDRARYLLRSGNADRVIARKGMDRNDTLEAHSFDITPAMHSEAEQGMPLFAERKKLSRTNRPKSGWSHSQPDTATGKKLSREMDRKGSKVGLRSITDMLANALNALYIRTKSQTSEKHPAHYRGKPLRDLPAIHAIFDRTNSAEINYHELGHALSSIFRDLDQPKYEAWQNYWPDALKQLSNDGFSSVPDSFEEGIAEALRKYLTDPGSLEDIKVQTSEGQKTFLEGFDELLDMAPEEAKAVRDAHRLYTKHRERSIVEQDLAMMNDKGLKATGFSKTIERKWRDWLTVLYGMTIPIQALRNKVYKDMGGGTYNALTWLTGMARTLYDPVYRQEQKAAAAATKKIVDKHDLPTLWNLVARIPAEASRVFHGSQTKQKGLRIFADKDAFRKLDFPDKDDDGNPMTPEQWLAAYAGAGIPLNLTPTEDGDALYLINPKTLKPIKLWWEIKEAIGDLWDTFEVYGQIKTTLSRLKKHPDMNYPDKYYRTPEAMEQAVKEFEAKHPHFVEQYDHVTALMDALLSMGVLSGEIPVNEALRIKWSYEHYWPQEKQKRDGSSSGLSPAYGEGKEIVWDSGIHRAFGSDLPLKRLDDIAYTRITKAFSAYYNSKLFDAFLGLSKEVAKSDKLKGKFKEQVEWMQMAIPIGPDQEATNIDEESQQKIIKDYLDEQEAERQGFSVEELRNSGQGIKLTDIAISTPSRPQWTEVGPKMVNIVARTKGGRRQYYHIPDPFLFQIFKANPNLAAQAGPIGEALKWMGAFIVPFKGVLTRSLAFAFHNMFYRDPLTALTSGKSWVPLKYSYLGLRSVIRGSKGLKALMPGLIGDQTQFDKEAEDEIFTTFAQSSSPLHGFRDSAWDMLTEGLTHQDGRPIEYNPDRIGWPKAIQSSIGAAISVMLKPMDILNWSTGGWWLSPRGENIARKGAFIAAREEGQRMDQALSAADNLAGNYNQKSHNLIMGAVDRQAMFLKARLQVGYQFVKQVLDPNPYVRGTAVLKLGYIGALHAGMVAASVLIARSLAQALGDDDWVEEWLKSEDERTDADKARMGTLPFGIPLRIPFDDGIPSMFASIGHNMAISHLAGHKERGETVDEAAAALWERVKGYVGADLSQLINPYLRTALEAKINLRLYNTSRIIPDGVAAVYEPKLQTTPSTPESYNEVAEWLSKYKIQVSPLMLRHVVKNTGFRFADQWAAWADGRNTKELADFPVLGQLFTQEPKGFSSQSVLSLQEMDRRFTAAKKSLIQAMNAGDEARRAEAAERLMSLQGYQQMYNQIESQWKTAKKLKDAGRIEEAADMERLMTETARRGLRDVAIMRASQEQGGRE